MSRYFAKVFVRSRLANCRTNPNNCNIFRSVPRQNTIQAEKRGVLTMSVGFRTSVLTSHSKKVSWSLMATYQPVATHPPGTNRHTSAGIAHRVLVRWSTSMRLGRSDGEDRRASASKSHGYLGSQLERPRVLPGSASLTRGASSRRGVADVLSHQAFQMPLVEYNHMVE